jgi:alpha-tubulin suppressor-like RCC1 family protein
MHKLADDGEPSRTNSKIVRACAGNNHSVAISSHGKTFTWGYGGKGLLGRATTYKTSEK